MGEEDGAKLDVGESENVGVEEGKSGNNIVVSDSSFGPTVGGSVMIADPCRLGSDEGCVEETTEGFEEGLAVDTMEKSTRDSSWFKSEGTTLSATAIFQKSATTAGEPVVTATTPSITLPTATAPATSKLPPENPPPPTAAGTELPPTLMVEFGNDLINTVLPCPLKADPTLLLALFAEASFI